MSLSILCRRSRGRALATLGWFGLCGLAAVSASHAAEVDSPDPLAVGLRWQVSVEIKAPDGSVQRGKGHREITGTEVIRGTNYFVSLTRFTGLAGMEPYRTFRRKGPDGIYAIVASDPDRTEYLEAALPLEVGRSWTMTTKNGQTFFRVIGRETIQVGGKKYKDCFRLEYDSTGPLPHGHYYLAPGVGNISETFSAGDVKVQVTLDSFEKGEGGKAETLESGKRKPGTDGQ